MTNGLRHRFPSIDLRTLIEVVGFVVLVNVLGSAPGVVFGPDSAWFRALEKPWFYPPELAFPVVWTLLFTLLGISLWLVWRADSGGLALGLFVVQFALNVAWTPAFFGLESIVGGIAVLVPLVALVCATVYAFWRVDRRAAVLLVPYLLWVTFALALTLEFWRLNPA
ncbi:TspO/MBR family protein [Halovivax gelatinilyticus]|uniref:TspO/MBR family protein n=1 Tax=Halovivax gelatinilyticus TaxID=2961597 RepID=UPI0020CA4CD0|nr:TspO/MBR family protein [Halovivax gelatinilyticus]